MLWRVDFVCTCPTVCRHQDAAEFMGMEDCELEVWRWSSKWFTKDIAFSPAAFTEVSNASYVSLGNLTQSFIQLLQITYNIIIIIAAWVRQ
jgi:hypothetical protein